MTTYDITSHNCTALGANSKNYLTNHAKNIDDTLNSTMQHHSNPQC